MASYWKKRTALLVALASVTGMRCDRSDQTASEATGDANVSDRRAVNKNDRQRNRAISPQAASRQREDPWDAQTLNQIVDTFMHRQMPVERIPGAAVAIVKEGATLLSKGYGVADVDTQKPVDPDTTIFRIGSVSKAVTGLAILRLADLGQMDLDRDVNSYLQKIRVDSRFEEPVTARHLLSHTGGFDQPGLDRNFDSADLRPSLVEFLKRDLTRIRRPGEQSCYDTYGISLAGHLIEAVSQKDYAEYMRDELFRPLRMTRTHVETPNEYIDDLAIGYSFDGSRYIRQEYEYYASTPASSIDSTVADMAKLMIAVLGGGPSEGASVFSKEFRTRLQTTQYRIHPEFPGFAFGFWEELGSRERTLTHGGTMRGFSCNLVLFLDSQVGVFVAANRDSETGPSTRLVNALVTHLQTTWFGRFRSIVKEPPAVVEIPTDRFAGAYIPNLYCHFCYEGEGWMPSNAITRVESLGNGRIKMNGRDYEAIGPLLFRDRSGEPVLKFMESLAGAITGFGLKQDLPGMTHEKLDTSLLDRMVGAQWKEMRGNPMVALVHRANENYEEAAEQYNAIAQSRTEGSFSRAIALIRLGRCRMQGGNTTVAATSFQDARSTLESLETDSPAVIRRATRLAARTLLFESEARTLMGELDQAFELIYKVIDQYKLPAGEVASDLRQSPNHKLLVADPRFAQLAQRQPLQSSRREE